MRRDLWLLFTVLLFLLSRFFIRYVLGLGFDTSSLSWAWQLLDPLWLKEDPLRSLWYMHMQPPLFNLLTALALHTPSPGTVLDLLFFTLGLLTSVLLYRLGTGLGLPRPLAFVVVAVVFTLNPSSFLYETWYFYTYPVLFLTSLLSLLLLRAVRRPSLRNLIMAFSVLTLLTLLRSSYHLLMFLLVGGALAVYTGRRWRAITAVLLLTSLPTFLWYMKNYVLFGTFSSTSWTGMNITRLVWNMPGWGEDRFRRLHEEGIVSALMTTYPFSPPEVYARMLGFNERSGVVVLDSLYEPTTGDHNYNHLVYPTASRILLGDNLRLFSRYPYIYFRALLSAFKNFTYPPYAYVYMGRFYLIFDEENLKRFHSLGPYLGAYDLLYGWAGKKAPGLTVLLIILGFILLLPKLFKRPGTGVLTVLLLYLVGVHTAFERRENMRFRFQFEAVLVLLVVSGLYSMRAESSSPRKRRKEGEEEAPDMGPS